ncbi:hypothetical protein KSS87_003227, partial [Heliosperma pusillum]
GGKEGGGRWSCWCCCPVRREVAEWRLEGRGGGRWWVREEAAKKVVECGSLRW